MRHLSPLLLLFCLLASLGVCAQDGGNDPSFAARANFGPNDTVHCYLELPGGRILLGGSFTTFKSVTGNAIAAVDAGGARVTGFTGSFVAGTGATASVQALRRQPDGRILVGGRFQYAGVQTAANLARIDSNGVAEAGFAAAGFNGTVYALELQADGKILVGGAFTAVGTTPRPGLARLLPDGSLDAAFQPALAAGAVVRALLLLPGGQLTVGGSNLTQAGGGLARLTTSGAADGAFTTTSNGPVYALALRGDGKLLLGGDFTQAAGTTRIRLARLLADGTLDNTFNPLTGPDAAVYALALQPGGSLLAGGDFQHYNGTSSTSAGLLRLDSSGQLLPAFVLAFGSGAPGVRAVSITASGRILLGGAFPRLPAPGPGPYRYYAYWMALDAGGAPDDTFSQETGIGQPDAWCLAQQPDGKVLVGGNFTAVMGATRLRIARLLPNGLLDPDFLPGNGPNLPVTSISVQQDGKIVLGGLFNVVGDNTARSRIARLNADGSPDAAFISAFPLVNGAAVRAVAALPSGAILVGGSFASYGGTPAQYLFRVTANGSRDPGFTAPAGPAGAQLECLQVQADGKIIAAGHYNANNLPRGFIIRLNADGSSDNSFTAPDIDNIIQCVAVQADGKILLGGDFLTCNGQPARHLLRLLANGSVDAGFSASTDSTVFQLALVPGGIVAGGSFTQVNGVAHSRIARLNFSGDLDNGFQGGTVDGTVKALSYGPGGLLVGGSFMLYDGQLRNGITRANTSTVLTATGVLQPDLPSVQVGPNPVTSQLQVRSGAAGSLRVQLYSADGRSVLPERSFSGSATLDLQSLPSGLYLVEIRNPRGGAALRRMIVKL